MAALEGDARRDVAEVMAHRAARIVLNGWHPHAEGDGTTDLHGALYLAQTEAFDALAIRHGLTTGPAAQQAAGIGNLLLRLYARSLPGNDRGLYGWERTPGRTAEQVAAGFTSVAFHLADHPVLAEVGA